LSDRVRVVSRCLLAIVGGYAVTTALFAAVGRLLNAAGVSTGEVMAGGSLLAPLLYLAILVWAFHDDRLARVGGILAAFFIVSGAVLFIVEVPA
jgi:hypothetical protein